LKTILTGIGGMKWSIVLNDSCKLEMEIPA
jgi:hypothetical protein